MKNLKSALILVFSVAALFCVEVVSAQGRDIVPSTLGHTFDDNPYDEDTITGSTPLTPEEAAVLASCDESFDGYDPEACDEALDDLCESGIVDCNPVPEEDLQNPTDDCEWDGCSEELEGQ